MKTAIDFYFDFISPYGYLGSTQVERIAHAHGREVEWRPFLLGITVMKVMGLKPLMETPLKSDYVRLDKPRMASLLGVPLATPDMKGANSVAASRAFYWMKDRDPALAVELARRLLRRLWVEGRETTSPQAVAEEAQALGVERQEFLAALETPAVKDRLRAEVDACVARGVFGSPFFIVDEQPIWGVDRLWMLEHWLRHGHWNPA
jgi:2-hydroxychromene-2-carboxylate isomerase